MDLDETWHGVVSQVKKHMKADISYKTNFAELYLSSYTS